jgi:hypothetical protein
MPPKKDAKKDAKKEEDDGEKKGLELLLYTIYEEAFAYRSIKQMKIWDWRLTCAFHTPGDVHAVPWRHRSCSPRRARLGARRGWRKQP